MGFVNTRSGVDVGGRMGIVYGLAAARVVIVSELQVFAPHGITISKL
jgi:hypothetical protein